MLSSGSSLRGIRRKPFNHMYCLYDSTRHHVDLMVKHLHEDHGMTVKEIAHWFNCEKHDVKAALAKLAEQRAFEDEELAEPPRRKRRKNK